MKKIVFINGQEPALNDTNLNQLQDNVENAIAEAKAETETIAKEYTDSLQTYSTEEKVVGTWIDGKPIYRKVLEGTTPAYTSANLTTIPNLETLIDIRGVSGGTYKGGTTWVNLGVNPQQYRQIYVIGETVGIIQQSNEATPYRIILEYTKTTD